MKRTWTFSPQARQMVGMLLALALLTTIGFIGFGSIMDVWAFPFGKMVEAKQGDVGFVKYLVPHQGKYVETDTLPYWLSYAMGLCALASSLMFAAAVAFFRWTGDIERGFADDYLSAGQPDDEEELDAE